MARLHNVDKLIGILRYRLQPPLKMTHLYNVMHVSEGLQPTALQ